MSVTPSHMYLGASPFLQNPISSNQIIPPHDEGISREHALIAFDPDEGTYVVEDLQSTNGTKVNGKRVRSSLLADGDDLQIGHTHFQFLLRAPTKD